MTYTPLNKLSFLIFFILLNYSCKNENTSPEEGKKQELTVSLNLRDISNGNDNFFPENYKIYPAFSTLDISKEEYQKKIDNFIIPEIDTFLILTESFRHGTFYREIMLKENYQRNLSFYKDSLEMFNDVEGDKLNILSGFKNDSQILIPDLNNNQNFTDDPVLTFSKNPLEKGERTTSENLVFKYRLSVNDESLYGKRKIQIYPDPTQKYTELLSNDLSRRLAISFKPMDYWEGEYKTEEDHYKIAIQGLSNERVIIAIKNEKLNFSNTDQEYDKNFLYNIGDTLQLNLEFFKIENIKQDFSEIIFKKLEIESDEYKSYRIGNFIQDFVIENLENQHNHLSSIHEPTKKFILLDFWGTWCQPCLELTPELKRFYEEKVQDVDLISIALDESSEKVKNYVLKNNIMWPQGFVNRSHREGIIRDLRIQNYPTFILLDQNWKIIYRGSGKEAFYNIEDYIDKN